MEHWFLFSLLAVVIWLVSLRRILSSSAQPNCSFISTSTRIRSSRRKSNVLLVVAHPDDESMFFTPTILNLTTSNEHNLHIICMSNGNADGKGNIREEELYRACAVLKIPRQQIKIIDHPDLQDGFDQPWKHKLLATFIEEEIIRQSIDVLITFDNHGVSNHPNHCDIRYGISFLLREHADLNIEVWELISTSIIRKYIGPVDIWISLLTSLSDQSGRSICCVPNQYPRRSYQAMAEHYSQWVWYRKLFVLFSRYTYINTLRRITA